MANATLMCQAFNKRANDWQNLESTKRYIGALLVKQENPVSLIETRRGNSSDFSQGTWIHEKLIIKLAEWLDVEFEIWCDEKIAELLRTGAVSLASTPKTDLEILSDAMLIANRVIAEKDTQIKKLAPKAEYTEKVLQSETTHTATEIAQEFSLSPQKLNKILCELGIQRYHRDHYVLLKAYQGKGYEKITTQIADIGGGRTRSCLQLEWTEYGRVFIHSKLNTELSFSKSHSPQLTS